MPKIPDEVVRRVLDRAKIEDVVGDFVTLRKAGVNLTGICPFHDDKHDGNFIVRPSTISEKDGGNTYKCFVCEKKGGPVQFLMEHERLSFPDAIRWLGKKYNEPVDDIPLNYTPPPPRPKPKPLPTLILPRRLVSRSMEAVNDTNFIKWLRSLPWDGAQLARIDDVLKLYCVGRDKDGWTLFWQVDADGNVLNGKLMKYLENGHRDKGEDVIAQGKRPFTTDWIHSRLKRKRRPEDPWPHPELFDPDKQEAHYTFFGMHLLNRYPKAVINIVESEKTAIICAIAYGSLEMNLWMACGGKTGLSNKRMDPLFRQKRSIVLWPDTDGMDEWTEWIKQMNQPSISIQRDFFKRYYIPELDGKKADVADLLVRWMLETNDGKQHQQHETKVIADIIPEAVSKMIGNDLPGALEDEEPFFINTPLQQRLHDAVERNKKKINNQPIIF